MTTRNDERDTLPVTGNTDEMTDAELESVVAGKEPNRPNRPNRPRPR